MKVRDPPSLLAADHVAVAVKDHDHVHGVDNDNAHVNDYVNVGVVVGFGP